MEKIFLNCETFVLQQYGDRTVVPINEVVKLVKYGILANQRLEAAAYAMIKPVDHDQDAIDSRKKQESDREIAKAADQAAHLHHAIEKARKTDELS